MYHRGKIGFNSLLNVPRLPNFSLCVDRHVDKERGANDVFPRDESPIATVVRIISIIAHHEVHALRDDKLSSGDMRGKFRSPSFRRHLRPETSFLWRKIRERLPSRMRVTQDVRLSE